ncbi:Uma2 family endonuclease [Fibrella forsythiae]|uniref:Uma2 family endonuclease n=1 Tax=Fibrella forsythiae TaxID=2817061 RepID=A0ABS3JMB3_9BACT|nr:Uma2 family endonuclease [Fibrella forsythiae]MBO0950042.1 Uma2 family endonuclease [Fibrella forsythiae]
MEATTILIPMTLAERGAAPDEVRVSATWDEYVELAEEIPYNIEFLNGEIISMSQATDLHGQLIAQLITLFNNLLDEQPDYRVLGSSVKICIAEGGAEFNADLSVVRGPSEYVTLPGGKVSTARIKNPEIVVEVLSKSTKAYDQSDKLDQYRLIPSLRHILFVSQDAVFARVYSRTDKPDQWVDTDYRLLTDIILVGEMELPMQKIYRKTPFSA